MIGINSKTGSVPWWHSISRAEWGVVAFTLFYMGVSFASAVVRQNSEFVYYLAVMGVLIAVVCLIHWRIRLHPMSLWGMSIWGLAHMAGGLVEVPHTWPINGDTHVLYNWQIIHRLLKYDQLVHAYGFGLVTWICWQGLSRIFASRGLPIRPTLGLLVICSAGGMGFGALNELVEFVATLILAGTNVGGYENTGWDLVANLAGCILASTMIRNLHPNADLDVKSPLC
jgi:hypothetical protein